MKTQEKKVFCAGLVSLTCTDQCELLMSMDIILTMADHVSNSVVDFRKDYFGLHSISFGARNLEFKSSKLCVPNS